MMKVKVTLRRRLRSYASAVLLLIGLAVLVALLLYQSAVDNTESPTPESVVVLQSKSKPESPFLIDTIGCKIQKLNPFDKSVVDFVGPDKKIEPVICLARIVTAEGRTLKMKSVKESGVEAECCYQKLEVVTQDPDNYKWEWGDNTVKASGDCRRIYPGELLLINDSFIKVDCISKENQTSIESDYFTFVQPPELLPEHTNVMKKLQRWGHRKGKLPQQQQPPSLPPNILIIGLDSASRLNTMRSLPKTRQLLQANDFVELLGFTKVGVNTLPVLMAILTGLEIFPNYTFSCHPEFTLKFDDCPFLWKNFSNQGYLTAFLQDLGDTFRLFQFGTQGTQIVTAVKDGFVEQPTDYYVTPLLTTARKVGRTGPRLAEPSKCMQGGLTYTNTVLRYTLDFLEMCKSQGYPYFNTVWLADPCHDDPNGLRNEDENFHNLWTTILTSPNHDPENSIIFFIGDHGFRMGPYRETFIGSYEDSLPMSFVRLGSNLKARFPHWHPNLVANTRRLTSAFDIHETLKDILQLSATTKVPEGHARRSKYYSLVGAIIPENRTCAQAGVQQQDCMCVADAEELELLNPQSAKLTNFSRTVLNNINDQILVEMIAAEICEQLVLKSNLYGRRIYMPESQAAIHHSYGKDNYYYHVGFEVSPSNATFEAYVIELGDGRVVILGDIYRLNQFKGQSDCVGASPKLQKYCYCSDLLP